jgi:hypothetical protein
LIPELSFGTWILVLSTLLYLIAGVAFVVEGRMGLAISYIAYAVANVGLMMVAIQGN